MNIENLSRLKRVDLRQVWKSESSDFTPWLALEENLRLLGDTIGLELECEAQEKRVGPFRADILCKDLVTNDWVLIENQLEKTDHSHLGQLLTYAAGLEAVTVVWIAERFTDEHRAALDWLNEHTDDTINFFGIEVELWQIGDSPYAPKFNLVSQPNEWTRTIAVTAKQLQAGTLNKTEQILLQFWSGFVEFLIDKKSFLKPRTPRADSWMNFSMGRSEFRLECTIRVIKNQLAAVLIIDSLHAKSYFAQLKSQQNDIESEFGVPLEWDEAPDKKQSRIRLRRDIPNATDQNLWPEYFLWLKSKLEGLYQSFSPRIKNLELPEEENSGEDPAHA